LLRQLVCFSPWLCRSSHRSGERADHVASSIGSETRLRTSTLGAYATFSSVRRSALVRANSVSNTTRASVVGVRSGGSGQDLFQDLNAVLRGPRRVAGPQLAREGHRLIAHLARALATIGDFVIDPTHRGQLFGEERPHQGLAGRLICIHRIPWSRFARAE
jgi:hypothetical protein